MTPESRVIPRGWDIDHASPSDFVVRCASCGRVSIRDERAEAHTQAQSHALRCSQTGVTPVARPEGSVSLEEGATDETADVGAALLIEGVNPRTDDVVGTEIVVRYESIQSGAGTQTASGLIDSTIGGESESYRGLELVRTDGRRLRIDVVDGIVLCEGRELNSGDTQWRKIGEAEVLRPARVGEAVGESAVATDGGVR